MEQSKEIIPHTRIPQELMDLATSATELAILLTIAKYYDRRGRKLATSRIKIAESAFLSVDTVKDYFHDFSKRGIIREVKRGNQYKGCSEYDIPLLRAYYDAVNLPSTYIPTQITEPTPAQPEKAVEQPQPKAGFIEPSQIVKDIFSEWEGCFFDPETDTEKQKINASSIAQAEQILDICGGRIPTIMFFRWYKIQCEENEKTPKLFGYLRESDFADWKADYTEQEKIKTIFALLDLYRSAEEGEKKSDYYSALDGLWVGKISIEEAKATLEKYQNAEA